MPGDILIERKRPIVKEDLNSIVFRLTDAVKEILRADRQQKQPLILYLNEQMLIKVIKELLSNKNKRCLIAAAGESASGKTTFINYTAKALNKKFSSDAYTVLCCDDYYKDTSMQLKQAGSFEALLKTGFSFDTPEALNLELMRAHLISLKNGCGVIAPEYDFITCESRPGRVRKEPSKVVLAEGLYVLGSELQDLFDIKIYVFTPFEIIKDRWFKRSASRGKTGQAAELQFKDVNEAAQIYIRPAMKNAGIVVNGLTSAEYIEELTEKIVNAAGNILNSRRSLEF